MKRHTKRFTSFLLVLMMVLSLCPRLHAKAETLTEEDINNHQIVKNRYPTVVSLGDSFSSGESGEDYYGMNAPLETRISDEDWLAHRSADSWPGQLTFVNEDGNSVALKDYRYNPKNNAPQPKYDEDKWFFAASSGAVTADFEGKQKKDYDLTKEEKRSKEYERQKKYQDVVNAHTIAPESIPSVKKETSLTSQKEILDKAKNADYVTITIGGNDVGFADIVLQCVASSAPTFQDSIERSTIQRWKDSAFPNSPSVAQLFGDGIYRNTSALSEIFDWENSDIELLKFISKHDNLLTYRGLDNMLADVMRNIQSYGNDIKEVYSDIHESAPDAAIIVAGYPRLLYSNGGTVTLEADGFWNKVNDAATSLIFSEYEAETVNENVIAFNNYLLGWVNEVRRNDNIPIYFVDVADSFGDRGAYAPGAYIHGVLLGARQGELNQNELFSKGSFHPNAEGRKCYAQSVQEFIDEKVELKQIAGKVRIVDSNMNVSAAREDYIVELTPVKNPSLHITAKTGADGTFKTDDNIGINKGLTVGEYSIRVIDPQNRECGLLGNDGSAIVELMYHTAGYLDILVSPGKQEVSGTLNIRTVKNKAVKVDFSEDPLMLSFTDKFGRTEIYPAEDQTPITYVGNKGVKYSVMLFPGDYTIEAFGKNSGLRYSFSVDGKPADESVSVPVGKDVKNKDMTLLGNSQTYVGTWVDEISYSSVFGISSSTKMTLELGKMMDASLTLEATADISMYGWSESGLPASNNQADSYQGTWQEVEDGIVFYLSGDPNGPIYFNLVDRDILRLNLEKMEALAASSSQEGLTMVALLEVFKLAMSMDIGSLFGMNFGTSANDMLGINGVDDLLYFAKQK